MAPGNYVSAAARNGHAHCLYPGRSRGGRHLTAWQYPAHHGCAEDVSGLNSFTLLAVPLFVLAANIMNRGKISEKLIEFSDGVVGHFAGGLAYTNVLVFHAVCGHFRFFPGRHRRHRQNSDSGMIKEGYSKETSVGVTAASSTIGIIVPPSIPMVVYSSVAGASIGALFLGGIVSGCPDRPWTDVYHLDGQQEVSLSQTRAPDL